MSEEIIRKHLRAALSEIVTDEKSRLRKIYDSHDRGVEASIKMMDPIIQALNALSVEVPERLLLDVSTGPLGQVATVQLNPLHRSFSISTIKGNTSFEVKVFDPQAFEKHKELEFSSPEDVLKLVLTAVGEVIARDQVLGERMK